ncbi:hypothetical protein BJV82DRAFT_630446 [Fennellomyces sp. T-0311]|nr:hypothetical protein BJV82DRAFT_630446 [Fennellomyces sp. T-0311]
MPINKIEYEERLRELNVTPLEELVKGRGQNCCAVVKTAKPVRRSGGVDYVQAMTITDPSLGWNRTMSVNLFLPKEEAFAPTAAGDLIVFHSLLIHEYYSKNQGRNLKNITTWVVVDRKTQNPRKNDFIKLEMSEEEQKVIEMLSQWSQENAPSEPESSPLPNASLVHGSSRSRTAIATEQVESHKFYFDYLGEVVSYNKMDNTRSVLFVTDYTRNPRPPKGEWYEGTIRPDLLLPITLWDEQSENCPHLEPGDFIFMENLKSKTSRDGTLEASLRGDRGPDTWNRCKVKKIPADDVFVKAIIERKEKYFSQLKKSNKPNSDMVHEIKPKQIISVVKGFKRKFKAISDVLNDTDIPLLYKMRAKVVDYKPYNVTDWVRIWCSTCGNSYPSSTAQCGECKTPINSYILQGAFLVEDSKLDKMILYVYGEDSVSFKVVQSGKCVDMPPAKLVCGFHPIQTNARAHQRFKEKIEGNLFSRSTARTWN